MKLFYKHENAGTKAEDYKSGDVHIGSAAEGSRITVVTDNSGITMTDEAQIYEVLNALAGKTVLRCLQDRRRKTDRTGDNSRRTDLIIQDLGNERHALQERKRTGICAGKPTPPAELSPITGDAGKDKYYAEKKIRQADGTYLFKENTDLQMTDGQPMVSSEKPVVIKAEGKKLSLTSAGDRDGTISTVQQNSKDNLSITAKELVVKAENKSGRSEGIHLQNGNKQNAYKTDITGDVTIQSKGKGYALGAYVAGNASLNIHGNLSIKGEDGTWGVENTANPGGAYAHYSTAGLYAGSNYAIQKRRSYHC